MSTANGIVWARWATAIAGGLVLAGAANAHHSFSVFDMTTEKTIEGDIVFTTTSADEPSEPTRIRWSLVTSDCVVSHKRLN